MTGTISLAALFAAQARATPDAVALVAGDEAITYRVLDRHVDEMTGRLRAAGVTPGRLVPLLLPRGRDLVVLMLATLRAGAVCCVLDPQWPAARLAELLAEIGTPWVIVGDDATTAPPGTARPVRDLAPGDLAGAAAGVPPETCGVVFTSGTTGRPKGVLLTHVGVARLFGGAPIFRTGPDTVMPLAAAVGWDGFLLELWSVLLTGGRGVVVDEPFLSPQTLRTLVADAGVNSVFLTASLFNVFVAEDVAAFAGVSQVISGGERMSAWHARRLLETYPDLALVNAYGPIEGGIVATVHRVSAADCDRPGGVPVGRAAPRTGLHLRTDETWTASGETGELWLTGAGLAAGYLRAGELTAASFPALDVDGTPVRAYRTGDLMRRNEDGMLTYVGRADRQVKIKGHRIEPAEVERIVERVLAVPRCAVVVAARGRLLACCVGAPPADVDPRAALAAALPDHLVPDEVVWLDRLPLTANGKVDEARLLAASAGPGGPAPDDAPVTDPRERAVLEIVHELTGHRMGRDDDLASTGLDSLGRLTLGARLTARFGAAIPVGTLYRLPNPVALAAWLAAAGSAPAERSGAEAPPPEDEPLDDMRMSYLMRHLTSPSDRTAHCLTLWSVTGPLDLDRLQDAVDVVHARHPALSRAYLLDPDPVARPVRAPGPAVETADPVASVHDAVELLRDELGQPLDLEVGEVWRVAVVPVPSEGATVLGYVVHHIAFDGASESVLAADLARAYTGRTGPAAPSDGEVRLLRRERARHTDPAPQLRHWVTELADAPELKFPAGLAGQDTAPRRLVRPIGAGTVAAAERTARAHGVPPYALYLSCYGRALAASAGTDDVVVGFPVSGRDHPALAHVVGAHLGMLCVRLRGAPLAPGADGVAATGRALRAALAAQDVSWPRIVAEVNPARTGRPPIVQNLFVHQGHPIPELPGVGDAARLIRIPYLQLPYPVHTELWPAPDGGLSLTVSYRPADVDDAFAGQLADGFTSLLSDAIEETAP